MKQLQCWLKCYVNDSKWTLLRANLMLLVYCIIETTTNAKDKNGSNVNVIMRQLTCLWKAICLILHAASIFWHWRDRIWIRLRWNSTGTVWFVHLLLIERNPVHAWEPLVATYVLDPVLQIAIAFGEVNLEQVAQKILDVGAKMRWKANLKPEISIAY